MHTDRYSEGSVVVLKSAKITTFNNKVSFTADAATVFEKVALNPEASDEIIGDGDPLVTLDVYSDASKSNKIRTITKPRGKNTIITIVEKIISNKRLSVIVKLFLFALTLRNYL